VIIPDINLLVYAHNADAPLHTLARTWWTDLVSREQPIAVPWAVTFGFIRLVTHASVMTHPVPVAEAMAIVEEWFAIDNIRPLDPGPRHLQLATHLFAQAGVAGNLTTDVHLAALALENQAELHSNDADFGRFSGLRWVNPLA